MALTLEIDQRLQRFGLIDYFVTRQTGWQAVAQEAYDYAKKQFGGAQIRPDDLAKFVRPVVEIDKDLRGVFDAKKCSQKYWIDYFTSLIVDRTWASIKK
jgi:hypothetical protein